ncbi:MAG TPA: hypothetical protein VN223_06360 [Candidatus Elarobacter sp.]|nr:hypothetical protein [Candidatus Elarobacter sp.]
MLKIAKTAAFILAAMAPVMAVAQKSQGRTERKPSPSSSASIAPGSPVGMQAPPASQQLVTSENFFRANSKANVSPGGTQSAMPVVRPTPPIPASSVIAPPAVPPTVTATSVPAADAQPVVISAPSPEATAVVHYAKGQLTLISKNASLGTVLKLISAKTGALIDLAPELQSEPVIAQIGPGPVREVLTGLLDSPRIDYIIMGTGDASGSPERIVVRTRQSFARTAMTSGRPSRPQPHDVEAEPKPDEEGHPAIGVAPAAPMTQEQLMENWKKIREGKRVAEIEQQRQDRENEKTQVEPQPQPQPEPQPEIPPADNQPLN